MNTNRHRQKQKQTKQEKKGDNDEERKEPTYPHGRSGQCRDLYGDSIFPRYKTFTRRQVRDQGYCSWLEQKQFACSRRSDLPNGFCFEHDQQFSDEQEERLLRRIVREEQDRAQHNLTS